MAIYIYIRKVRDVGEQVEYEYGTDGAQPGLLRISRSTGEVALLAESVPEVADVGHFRRAEYKLRQHWNDGSLPDETCWAS